MDSVEDAGGCFTEISNKRAPLAVSLRRSFALGFSLFCPYLNTLMRWSGVMTQGVPGMMGLEKY